MTATTPRRPDDRTDVWAQAAAQFTAWRAGESRAFDALVRTLTPVLWQVVRAYRLDTPTAEDVLQETWLTLARDPDAVRDPAAVGGWLLTTARRRAWRAVAPSRELADSDAIEDAPPLAPAAETDALANLDRDVLWRAVADLSERCQRLLRIVAFDDRPDYGRIAADLGMPLGSIGPTRRRCLDKLRACLEGTGRV